jgi:hypothetical protein
MKPETLHNPEEYNLIAEVNYKSILGFVVSCLKPLTPVLWVFYIFLILTIINLGYTAVLLILETHINIFLFLGKGVLWLFISMIPIIPIHELLHGAAFKLMGAKKLTFGANLKEMVLYVTADKFVLSKKMLYFLALTPFVFFSVFFGVMCLSHVPLIKGLGALLLAVHASCCIGDFALMSYFYTQSKEGEVFTYDDTETKTSFYFRKIKLDANDTDLADLH